MKNLLLILVVSVIGVTASAQGKKASAKFSREYGMAGCGLGSVIVGKSGAQIFAATTNSTAYNQMFGITFNTLNCLDGTENQVADKTDFYIHTNQAAIQGDIARGSGETLAALSKVLRCDSPAFGSVLQKNYGEIYTQENLPANEVTDAIITVIKNDETLSAQCSLS